jgi:hypothetical protein
LLQRLLSRTEIVIWAALIVLLPVTSLPLLSHLAGGTMVAPPSAFLAILLVIFGLLPALWRGGRLPGAVLPLLAFVGLALIVSLAAFFFPVPMFRDTPMWRSELEGFITLGMGVCVFLAAAAMPQKPARLGWLLRLVNWSGAIILVWAILQTVFWQTQRSFPSWMHTVQSWLTLNELYKGRASGFAFEPSWLAHQLNMLYLPVWAAASFLRISNHRWRVFHLSFENLLLLGGVAALWFSYSRVGLLAFLISLGYLLWLFNRWLHGWLGRSVERIPWVARLGRRQVSALLIVLMLAAYLSLFIAAATLLSKFDPRMAKFFDFTVLRQLDFMAYANQLIFAERVVYWKTGWDIWNDHPLGVGLGNAGYYFPQKMSAFGWGLLETNTVMSRMAGIPNVKSLWVRLLAETGIAGFALYVSWIFSVWKSATGLNKEAPAALRIAGLAGQLAIVALLVEGFSLDTFGLPYLWLTLGLAVAAYRLGKMPTTTGTITP